MNSAGAGTKPDAHHHERRTIRSVEMVIVALAVALTLVAGAGWTWRRRAHAAEGQLTEVLAAATDSGPRPSSALAAVHALRERGLESRELLGLIEQLVDRSGLGIMVLDPEMNVEYVSAAAGRLVDARHGDAAIALQIRAVVDNALAERAPLDQRIESFDGQHRVLRVRVDPLDDGGASLRISDITEEERLDAMRRDFVANVGHELKTPVGALAVLAEAIQQAPDESARTRLAARLAGESARVAALVDDVMELSLVEREIAQMTAIDLEEVITIAAKRVELFAEDSGIEVIVELPASPVAVAGNRLQLVSAVANLIDNGIKYTNPSGNDRREVLVRLLSEDGCAVIEVEDFGIGIPEPHQSRIFERFYRVDRSRSRVRGGTGLGLAMVRHVARNHGGVIEVNSTSGVGSTFRLRLPGATGSC